MLCELSSIIAINLFIKFSIRNFTKKSNKGYIPPECYVNEASGNTELLSHIVLPSVTTIIKALFHEKQTLCGPRYVTQ